MKNVLKRLVALVLCAVLLVSLMPVLSLPAKAAASYPNTHVNTGNMAADIVAVAVSQAGYCEGSLSGNPSYASSNNYQKYGQWYDNNVDNIGVTYAAWCAAFVSWCANQAGVPSSVVYYHAYCPYGVNWFRNQGRFQYAASRGGSYVPKAGDIVYFAPAGSSTSSHVGIVRYVKNGYVYTVEGNTSGQNGEVNEGGGVFLKSYSLSYSRLYGYGTPNYADNSGHTIAFDSNGGSSVANATVVDGGTLSAPANPTRYGFNFVGWYCDPGLNDPYDFSAKVSYGFTLYAKWEEAYWGANTNLMPVNGLLVTEDFQSTGQYIWPYYNDDGSVTLYNGVSNDTNWSWPSAYMSYENSFDSGVDAYIYVKYNATARFNATIDYLDADGNPQSVKLSQLAGLGDNDLSAGYNEFFVNFGQYAYDQGHLTTSDGSAHSRNIKYTKVTYYVVGKLDDYVRLYDMRLTADFAIDDPYANLMTDRITPTGGYGSYVYDDGNLTVKATTDAGYTVTLNPNKTFNPSDMLYLIGSIDTDVPFNVSMVLTGANGETTMHWRNEFYPVFGLAEAPEALPAGSWDAVMDLNGYFAWNGGVVSETTVKSVTIQLMGKGTFQSDILQAHRGIVGTHVADGLYAEGRTLAPAGSLLPVSGELQYNDFQGTGESVWDYYNDDGSVTLYNTVDGVSYSWPSGYMNFEAQADLATTPDIYLNYRASGAFNAEICYLDDEGNEHSVNLSEVAGLTTTDFPAGTYDEYIDFAAYLETQGHTPADGCVRITKVTYYVVGTKDDYVRLYNMEFTAEPEMVDPGLWLKHVSLSFEDAIIMNIYFTAEDLQDVQTMGLITYSQNVESWNVDNAEAVIPGWGQDETGTYYYVSTRQIAAQNLGDSIYFSVYAQMTDGSYIYSNLANYCPKNYAMSILNGNHTTSMKALVAAMLNYGAAAQTYFGYRTDALVNSDMTDAHNALIDAYSTTMMDAVVSADKTKAGEFAATETGFDWCNPSVSFEGAFSINYYFGINAQLSGDFKLYYWTQEDYQAAETLTAENASGIITAVTADSPKGEAQLATVSGIAAKELDRTVYIAGVYSNGTATYCSGIRVYHIGAYCKNQAATTGAIAPLAAATAVYGYYAKTYFA